MDNSDAVPPSQARRRVIYSCEVCRKRKMKCDRVRPSCNNCKKFGCKCIYEPASGSLNKVNAENKLEVLKKQLYNLEKERDVLFPQAPSDNIRLARMISFINPLIRNIYINAVKVSVSIDNVSEKMKDELFKDDIFISDMELMKNDLILRNMKLPDLINPYIRNQARVLKLVDHFFYSELYYYYSFIDKERFYERLKRLLKNPPMTPSRNEYVLIGTLLMIMRISYISFYNCDDSDYESSFVGTEAFTMAKFCVDKGLIPLHTATRDNLELLLLVLIYQRSSPELNTQLISTERITSFGVLQAFITFDVHIDPRDDPGCQYLRRLWYSLIEIDNIEFNYIGMPIQIHDESYTTELPMVTSDGSDDDVINESYQERSKIHDISTKLSRMLQNVRSPPAVEDYSQILTEIRQHNTTLDEILDMDSSTIINRWKKSVKFVKFLDLSVLEYMLTSTVFLFYDENGESSSKICDSLKDTIYAANRLIHLAYFLDPVNHPRYDLHNNFGFSTQFIPRILHCLHRVGQFEYTLFLKVGYQFQTNPGQMDPEVVKKISTGCYRNNKVIATSYKKLTDKYLFAKKFYLMFTFLSKKLHNSDLKLEDTFMTALSKHAPIHEFDNETLEYIAETIVHLDISTDIIDSSANNDFNGDSVGQLSDYIDSSSFMIDYSVIEQLENFLNSQNFTTLPN